MFENFVVIGAAIVGGFFGHFIFWTRDYIAARRSGLSQEQFRGWLEANLQRRTIRTAEWASIMFFTFAFGFVAFRLL